MRSTAILIFVLLISSCNLLPLGGGHTVLLYSQKRFRGQPVAAELSPGSCYRVGTNVASLNTEEKCVRLYVGRNCFGTSFPIYRRCNIDLGRCNVSRKIESMSLC